MQQSPHLVRGAPWVVLTPNAVEFGRLVSSVLPGEGAADADTEALVLRLSAALGVVVMRKGAVDLVSDGAVTLAVEDAGSPKRSGGQGDVLAGCTATLLSWAKAAAITSSSAAADTAAAISASPAALAACAGCAFTRHASASAFRTHRRAMTAPDVIDAIGPAFEALFPADSE